MHSEPDGRRPETDQPGARPALYALVIYLPDPLGRFLDELRTEVVPGCNPHAHVSVLPPRPLPVDPELAIAQAQTTLAGFAPFDVELGGIEKFDVTDVIFISVERGADQLHEMHRSLNQGALAFDEPFRYHPHVTLAQEIPSGDVERLRELTARRWREFKKPRAFRAEAAMFVRNTRGNLWVDLTSAPLKGTPVGPARR